MKKIKINANLIKIILSIVLFILSFIVKRYALPMLILSYIIISYEIYRHAFQNIIKGEIFDENFLMIIATIGAFLIGKNDEAVIVILLFQIGEYLSEIAVNNSKKSITSLMDLRSDTAHIEIDGILQTVNARNINIGDEFVVKTGEKIPLDGEVVKGLSLVDTAALTGESVPRELQVGNEALSGFINKGSPLTIRATKVFEQSTASKIIALMEASGEKKTKTEKFITTFSRVYTPVIVFLAIMITLIPVLLGYSFDTWFYRSLVFLVISCPCALVISVPLGFFCGIGRASKEGILIKGSSELDRLSHIKMIAFDKTGTITEGAFDVTEIFAENGNQEEVLELAAYCEHNSNHPIAKSILKKYGNKLQTSRTSAYTEIPGGGIEVKIDGITYRLGNYTFMKPYNKNIKEVENTGLTLYLACDSEYVGYLVISDTLKTEALTVIKDLNQEGISSIVIVSGDHEKIVCKVAEEVGVASYYAEMLPEEKANKIEELKKDSFLAFVGDGINDAPVIKLADVGIAMGGIGSDAAIEAADVVIMRDDLSKIVTSIRISKRTKKIVTFTIVFALLTKIVVLGFGALGYTSIWAAVFADVGVTLLSILNALRILVIKLK